MSTLRLRGASVPLVYVRIGMPYKTPNSWVSPLGRGVKKGQSKQCESVFVLPTDSSLPFTMTALDGILSHLEGSKKDKTPWYPSCINNLHDEFRGGDP